MRPSNMTRITSLILMLLTTSMAYAQRAGEEDLDAAFDLKLKIETLGDYEEVVRLCKSAIKKGLDKEGEQDAKSVASSALFHQAEQVMIRLRRQLASRTGGQRDPGFFRNEGIKFLKEALKFNPELGDAWLLTAQFNLFPGGDQDEARSALDRAISLLDEEPRKQSEAYFIRSRVTRLEDPEESRADLDKSIEINDTNINALRVRCENLIIEGEVERGLEDHERILEANEGNVEILLAQGGVISQYALLKQATANQLENADGAGDEDDDPPKQSVEELKADAKKLRETTLEIYAEAVELAPEKPNHYLLKSRAERDLEMDEEALATVNTLLKRKKNSIDALLLKAELLSVDEENDEETLEVLDLAMKLDPYQSNIRRLRRDFFAIRQKYPEAIKEAVKLSEKEPNFLNMQQLANLHSLNSEPKKSIRIYDDLLERIPATAAEQLPPRQRLGVIVTRLGMLRTRGGEYLSISDHEKAIEDYEEALELGYQLEEIQRSLPNPGPEIGADDLVLNNLAWVLATSTKDDLRDGKRAIELATRACEATDYKAPHILSTLASGYAETGDFDKAIEWIEKGIEVNAEREIDDFVTEDVIRQQRESLEKELESYKQKKPWREDQAQEDEEAKKAEMKKSESDEDDSEDEDDEEDEEEKDDSEEEEEEDDDDKDKDN